MPNTNHELQKTLAWYVGKGQAGNHLYVGFMYKEPVEGDNDYNEPSASSYKRVAINTVTPGQTNYNTVNVFGSVTISGGVASVSNSQQVTFPETWDPTTVNAETGKPGVVQPWVEPTDDNGKRELRYVGLFDAATGGNLVAYERLETPLRPGYDQNGNLQSTIAIIRIGDLTIRLSNAPADTPAAG